ncbi:RHS repeat-associated core domain-containing protein [Flavobacterium rhizophilum]
MPFGEMLVDEHINSFNTPFKFNGKEYDEETGNYYYGARYYDPKWSMFIGVDPLAEKYPDWSSYAYCFNNPIRYVDPTGMKGEDHIFDIKGKLIEDTGEGSSIYIDIDGKRLKPSQLDSSNKEHRQAMANVAGYYRRQMKKDGLMGAAYDKKQPQSSFNPAYTPSDNIMRLNGNGCFSESIDDYNNLKNIIFHEAEHVSNHKGGIESTFKNHAEIYYQQMKDDTFSRTTDSFKSGTVTSFALYLLNMDKSTEENHTSSIESLINNFNALNTGYKLIVPNPTYQKGNLNIIKIHPDGSKNEVKFMELDN